MLSLAAGVAIVVHACVWATLCFTEVRSQGLTAVTHPDRVTPTEQAPAAEGSGGIVSVKSASNPPAVIPTGSDAGSSGFAPSAGPTASTAERFLAFLTAISTIGGVASLALLPIVLIVAFITALVRAPRAANASMAGILWAALAFATVLPWSAYWPQVPWPGLFLSYEGLIAETEALRATGNPFTFGALLSHVAVPGATIAILVGLAWRCGEALHAELMVAESLSIDPETDQDAAAAARKGPTIARSRSAAGLAVATLGPSPSMAASAMMTVESTESPVEERPRRLI